jgi:HK97 family phage major capsid protein
MHDRRKPRTPSKGIYMNLQDMKQQQKAALTKAEAIMAAAESANRGLTASEEENYNTAMKDYKEYGVAAKAREELNTIRSMFPGGTPFGNGVVSAPVPVDGGSAIRLASARNPEYARALHGFLSTGGKSVTEDLQVGSDGNGGFVIPGSEAYTRQRFANGTFPKMTAVTYEGAQGGSDAAGGYAISVPTDQLIVPLALPDLGIFDASMVIPTATDIKIPQQASFGTSAIKAESTGTLATFGGTDPALGQFTLTSFMVGALRWASWELLQDVQSFQSFIVDDLLKGQRILEGSLLAEGNGTTQPQAVFGNTGTGTGAPYVFAGTSADSTTLLESLFDVTATLKGLYQAGAVFVMSRATGLAIRRAQMQSNLFAPVVTVDPDGTERILGKPVFYDVNAPSLPSGTVSTAQTAILYGDFKAGYLIGVRGGAGINVKILDQPQAAQGLLGILAYRRLDARVRRSEAIQGIAFGHS